MGEKRGWEKGKVLWFRFVCSQALRISLEVSKVSYSREKSSLPPSSLFLSTPPVYINDSETRIFEHIRNCFALSLSLSLSLYKTIYSEENMCLCFLLTPRIFTPSKPKPCLRKNRCTE